jgi:hypothetical protein
MRIALIQYVIYWSNNIPKADQFYSPRDMVLGEQKLDFKNVCRIPFGAYVQVHDNLAMTNTMEPRTTGAINLGPTGNLQGGHRFLNLVTGEVMVHRKWTELPVPSEVILRLEEIAKDPMDAVEQIWEDDEDLDDPVDQTTQEENQNMSTEGGVENITQRDFNNNIGMEDENEGNQNNALEHDDSPSILQQEAEYHEKKEEEDDKENSNEERDVDNSEGEDLNVSTAETIVTSNTEQSRHNYNLRSSRQRDYSYRYAMLSLKAGIKRWGEKAKDAMLDELKLFLSEEVFASLQNPTKKHMENALRIHCFVIEKRDGRIKARAVADGRTQPRYYEEETYSPAVKLESIMLSSLIDAHEGQKVVTVDIKGAFLKAKVPDDMELIVRMDGELAKLMCELDPRFQMNEDGTLYLKCVKALYGHIEAARLFYDDLNRSLTEIMGFKRNQ